MKRQRFILPRTTEKAEHLKISLVRPKDAEHLRPMPNIETIRQVQSGVLSLQRVPIPGRRCLLRRQVTKGGPVSEGPGRHPQRDDPNRAALNLERPAPPNKR